MVDLSVWSSISAPAALGLTDSMLSIRTRLTLMAGSVGMGFRGTGLGVPEFLRWPTLTPAGLTCSRVPSRRRRTAARSGSRSPSWPAAVAQVVLDVARVHEDIAEQGRSLAAQASEHAKQAQEFAARERAEAERLRRVGRAEKHRPEQAN